MTERGISLATTSDAGRARAQAWSVLVVGTVAGGENASVCREPGVVS